MVSMDIDSGTEQIIILLESQEPGSDLPWTFSSIGITAGPTNPNRAMRPNYKGVREELGFGCQLPFSVFCSL